MSGVVHGHCVGRRRSALYVIWQNMIQRCSNPRHPDYPNYGGRVPRVMICAAWWEFAAFARDVEAELGPRPPGMSFDRVDPNGDYAPGNIRWASRWQQTRNRRRRAS